MKTSYQVAVIGSGSAGREAALLAARNGLSVVLIEKGGLGGTSFHRGYYTVRAFRARAEQLRTKRAPPQHFPHSELELAGWLSAQAQLSTRLVRESQAKIESAGIDICFGRASLADANTIEIDAGQKRFLRAAYIIIATGSLPGFETEGLGPAFVSTDQFLRRSHFASRVLIVGGNYVGCEIASILRSLGIGVTLVEKRSLLHGWDSYISTFIARTLADSGVKLHFGVEIDLKNPGGTPEEPSFPIPGGLTVSAGLVLVTARNRPDIDHLNLQALGIEANPFVRVDESLRTSVPHIYAIGDVNGLGLMDSHAVAQARTAVSAILGQKIRYTAKLVPRCVHTDPMVASVGWTEDEADRAGLRIVTHTQALKLVTADERSVLDPVPLRMKIIADSGSRQILGLHVIGRYAAELVNLAAMAIWAGITIDAFSEMIFVHPSPAEALQQCAAQLVSIKEG